MIHIPSRQLALKSKSSNQRTLRERSDRIGTKFPRSRQVKKNDYTMFKECSLNSLHPMAADALCYYRHSHGHFALKQGALSVGGTPSIAQNSTAQGTSQQARLNSNDMELATDKSSNNNMNQSTEKNRIAVGSNSTNQLSMQNNSEVELSPHDHNNESPYSDYSANEHVRTSANITSLPSDNRNHTDFSHSAIEHETDSNIEHQYHPQDSMFSVEQASKQKFQYVLPAPISIATKLSEDTMTYLNQAQAYEIKLENVADISEVKKGFMCSIINIGFHERHMQQAENELWQQWSQQHPNERIFSVDMKLSYNVFGVESDGLNKYEFLWDSSKAAGVFIRINSISTEFTLKKHGGEKGVPFKLSIETFSYNSKTHDSYFISAACCQIKVFKPKGAERKIRSDRDKIFKKPPSEQEKYHRPSDHTMFKECSLMSLHPMAADALCYYRHSHGHFALKRGTLSIGGTPSIAQNPSAQGTSQQARLSSSDIELATEKSSNDNMDQSTEKNRIAVGSNSNNQLSMQNDSEVELGPQGPNNESSYSDYRTNEHARSSTNIASLPSDSRTYTDYSTSRLIQDNNSYCRSSLGNVDNQGDQQQQDQDDHHHANTNNNSNGFGASYFSQMNSSDINFNSSNNSHHHSRDAGGINQMYHSDQARNSLTSINSSHQFNMAYHNYTIPSAPPHHTVQQPHSSSSTHSDYLSSLPTSYGSTLSTSHQQHSGHSLNSSAYKQSLSHHERPLSSARLGLHNQNSTTSFRASNLAISSQSSSQMIFNMPAHDSTAGDQESSQDKRNSLVTNSSNHYQHDNNVRTHIAPHQNVQNLTNQVCGRQRSASAFSANPPNAHCSYQLGGATNQYGTRPTESYSHPTEHPPNGDANWANGTISSDSSSCKTRVCTTGNQSHDEGPFGHLSNHSGSDNNLSSINLQLQYDSPNKSRTSNDSPMHCYLRLRGFNPAINTGSNDANYDAKSNSQSYSLHTINVNSTCSQVATWLVSNRFRLFSKTFSNFSGYDLLRLTKNELIDICGLLDGIRLYNSLHNQPIKPRKVLYICAESSEVFHPIYLYDVTLKELLKEITVMIKSSTNQPEANEQMHAIDDKTKKLQPVDRLNLTSTSSADSRSSIGAVSDDNGAEDVFDSSCRLNAQEVNHRSLQMSFFGESVMHHQRQSHGQINQPTAETRTNLNSNNCVVDRLLIEGLTSVKIVATEQVIHMLEDESVWTLSVTNSNAGSCSNLTEACISAYRSRRDFK